MKKRNKTPYGIGEVLYFNDTVDIIYEACTACYDNTKDINYFEKKKYIEKRIKCGHESVLEHGFVSFIISDISSDEYTRCISEIIGSSKYLSIFTCQNEDDSYNIMIGGSVRAYKHLIKEYSKAYIIYDDEDEILISNDNFIMNHIFETLYKTTVKEFYSDIEKLIPNYNRFQDIICNQFDYLIDINETFKTDDNCIIKDKFEIIGTELLNHDDELWNIYLKSSQNGFTKDEVDEILPITILFKNMSRTATHQLVRHRNAITQESQRYVDYSDAGFTIPDMSSYMEDYKDKKFDISLFGEKVSTNLDSLSKELINIYNQLTDQGLKKEDARAFLPSNVQCGRLYMTFTLNSLNKAIELRTDPHAQTEIREYFTEIASIINEE